VAVDRQEPMVLYSCNFQVLFLPHSALCGATLLKAVAALILGWLRLCLLLRLLFLSVSSLLLWYGANFTELELLQW